jgi:hypothetical protein
MKKWLSVLWELIQTFLVAVLFAATILAVKVMSLLVKIIGIKALRVRNGKLQTPVVFYEHPVTKRRIVFIGTMHYAEPCYFKRLQKLIGILEDQGYNVLYEEVKKLRKEEKNILTQKEQRILVQLQSLFAMMKVLPSLMSLQYQSQGIAYKQNWINTDITCYEIIRVLAKHNVTQLFGKKLSVAEKGALTKQCKSKRFSATFR